MTTTRTAHGFEIHTLTTPDGGTVAEIVPELGGIVSSLRLAESGGAPREILYRHPWFWSRDTEELRGGIPPLFPICGRLLRDGVPGRYLANGSPRILPIHGVAFRLPWEIADAGQPDALTLRLTDTPATREAYPFAFELELHYAIADSELTCRLAVRNTGNVPLPYYAGFHPYFATPPAGEGKEQTLYHAAPRRRRLYNDTLTDLVGDAPAPSFPVSVNDPRINEMLLETGDAVESRLVFPDGFVLRQIAEPILPFRQLYTLPDRPFFCDEPWMAAPGSLQHPGTPRLLPPGQSESAAIRLTGR